MRYMPMLRAMDSGRCLNDVPACLCRLGMSTDDESSFWSYPGCSAFQLFSDALMHYFNGHETRSSWTVWLPWAWVSQKNLPYFQA